MNIHDTVDVKQWIVMKPLNNTQESLVWNSECSLYHWYEAMDIHYTIGMKQWIFMILLSNAQKSLVWNSERSWYHWYEAMNIHDTFSMTQWIFMIPLNIHETINMNIHDVNLAFRHVSLTHQGLPPNIGTPNTVIH